MQPWTRPLIQVTKGSKMEPQRRRARRGNAEELNALTHSIIAAAIEVHRHLGPGLLESVYEVCLEHELILRGHSVERQKPLPVSYKGVRVDVGFRTDLLVDERVIVEVKATKGFHPIHAAKTLNTIKLNRPGGRPAAQLPRRGHEGRHQTARQRLP